HRFRPDALLPPPEPRVARAGQPRDLRPPDEARAAGDRGARPVRRVRDPEPVRDRVRAGLRRAVPESPLRGGLAPRSDAGRGVKPWFTRGSCRYTAGTSTRLP